MKTIVVLPAYNAEHTIARSIEAVPKNMSLFLVDDASSDGTLEEAKRLGIPCVRHGQNRGYGGNQKTCYAHALSTDAQIIVMLHPDAQYDARLIAPAVAIVEMGVCDVLLGNRIRSRAGALGGGMPLYKYLINRILTGVENILLGQNLGDFHSGFRVYRRKVLETIPFKENDEGFTFDSQFLIQAIHLGFRLGDVPMPVHYGKESSSIGFWSSTRYGFKTLWSIIRFTLHRWGVRRWRILTVPTDPLSRD